MSSSPILSRPELERFVVYKPGFSAEQIRRQYNLKKVIKLASNENTLGPSPKAMSAYKKAADQLSRYPETRSIDLRGALAEKHKLDIGHFIIGAGSDEIIELLAKTYLSHQDEVVVSASAFMQYRIVAKLMGASVITIPLKDMKHDLVGMANAVTKKTKLLFIANPNNPTGTYNTTAEVEKFFSLIPDTVLPVFDEAYFEYASTRGDYPSVIDDFFRKHPVVVLRTFSKIYGLAGLRVGYGVAPEECVIEMDKIRPPFNVSVPAQVGAFAALQDLQHLKKSIRLNSTEIQFLTQELEKMGLEVVPSACNFVLFKVSPLKGRMVFEELLQLGLIARSVDEYGLPDYLRVTCGTHKENKFFLEALREVLKKS
ncbi:MAG: Histidinol-phosphate aminotransferase [Elusimicrobia bacterium]|nr:Histidinol-phosphate aminotransferase [Elusimicrobiota bacterium]